MYGKIFIAVILIAFANVSSVQGKYPKTLKCYSYDSPLTFQHPKIEMCDQKSSNNTHNELKKYFSDLSIGPNKEFQCLSMSYVYKNSTVMAIGGCLNSVANTCSLNPLNKAWNLKECRSCSTDLCTLGVNRTTSATSNMTGSSNNSLSIASFPSLHHSSHSSSTSILISSMFILGLFFVNMLVN